MTFSNGGKHRVSDESTPLVVDKEASAFVHGKSNENKDTGRASALSWIRLMLFFVASVLTSGVVPGQNVYNRLFCEAGLFSYACREEQGGNDSDLELVPDGDSCCQAQWLLMANTMNALSMLMGILFLVAGVLFDALGGRNAAVLGCGLNVLGFTLLMVLLKHLEGDTLSPLVETSFFCLSVLIIDVGMAITNGAFFGFLWHLPHQQALILSLSTSSTNIAALLPLVIRYILRSVPWLTLPSVLGLYVVVIFLVATPICWWGIPSIDEFQSRAMEVLGMPIPRRKLQNWKDWTKLFRGAGAILLHDRKFHLRTILTLATVWMCPFVYMTMIDPMGQEIFSSSTSGEKLATLYNQWSAAMGFVAGPVLGIVVDRYGNSHRALVGLLSLVLASTLFLWAACPVPSWTVQTLNVIVASSLMICTMLYMNRYVMLFAPPHRMGTVNGLLVASLSIASLVPIVSMSVYIAEYSSYVNPSVLGCSISSVLLAWYLYHIRTTRPFPESPILLPDDELEVSKAFGVGTLEDAAYVAGMTLPDFRRLSSSSKILDQKALLDAALTAQAADRILEVSLRNTRKAQQRASLETQLWGSLHTETTQSTVGDANNGTNYKTTRNSSLLLGATDFPDHVILDDAGMSDEIDEELDNPPMPKDYVIPRYPIPDYQGFRVERGTAETALETIMTSFNGHGGFGGKSEQSFDWVMTRVGPPDNPLRIEAFEALFMPMVRCAEHYGTILEVRVPSSAENSAFEVAAVCCCFPPRGLEKGSVMRVGSDRYYFSLAAGGKAPVYLDRQKYGKEMLQRFAAIKQDAQWDNKREEYGPMWYIATLGTHPKHQGNGYGRILLDLVASWASRDGMDCYLECSDNNVPFYEKRGYSFLWRNEVEVDGTGTSMNGMVRKHQ